MASWEEYWEALTHCNEALTHNPLCVYCFLPETNIDPKSTVVCMFNATAGRQIQSSPFHRSPYAKFDIFSLHGQQHEADSLIVECLGCCHYKISAIPTNLMHLCENISQLTSSKITKYATYRFSGLISINKSHSYRVFSWFRYMLIWSAYLKIF